MKGMKGKVLKKMKSIKTIGFGYPLYQLRQDRMMLQAIAASDANTNSLAHHAFSINTNTKSDSNKSRQPTEKETAPAAIVVEGHVSDLLSGEEEEDDGDKENNNNAVGPKPKNTNVEAHREENTNVLSEINKSPFRRPDLNSRTLFDPNLLTAFQMAIAEHESKNSAAVRQAKKARTDDPVVVVDEQGAEEEEEEEEFEYSPQRKCPPGGADCVILYTTSLRGIRKTFEDCRSIRFLLESFRVAFVERDVSMHAAFREELQRTVGSAAVVPPRLFIRGRHIGGADRVLGLHERGRLRLLLQGIPTHQFQREPCEGCRGVRFVLCFRCDGGRKVMSGGIRRECDECNENGLLVCSACC